MSQALAYFQNFIFFIFITVAILIFFIFITGGKKKKQIQNLRSQGKLPPENEQSFTAVKALVDYGFTIEGIKMYRDLTGRGLKQAKQAIEEYQKSRILNEYTGKISHSSASLEDIKELLHQGNKVQAIKLYRELTGADLIQAKKAVENYQEKGVFPAL